MGAESPKEECGLFGVWAPGDEVARLTYFGLFAQQHRGQESAGIAVSDGTNILVYKDQPDAAKGEALVRFLWWAIHDGQKLAAALDYAPLPAAAVRKVEQTLTKLTVQGKRVLATSK